MERPTDHRAVADMVSKALTRPVLTMPPLTVATNAELVRRCVEHKRGVDRVIASLARKAA